MRSLLAGWSSFMTLWWTTRGTARLFDPLWNQLFPAEQSRIIQLLAERVDVLIDRVDIKLRIAGVTSLIGEWTDNSTIRRDAA
jgi:site-specific DNA recombinase